MDPTNGRARKWLITGAAALGVALGAAGIASAATGGDTSTTAAATDSSSSSIAPAGDPTQMANGPGETLLTGDTADKVEAAALEAVPGATVVRVETDSAGSPYEAHLTKSDGTQVTVKIDSSFNVTATEDGFGAGPGGQAPGAAPQGSAYGV